MENVYLEKIAAMNQVEKIGYGSSAGLLGASGAVIAGNFVNKSVTERRVAKSFMKNEKLGKNTKHIHKLYDKISSKAIDKTSYAKRLAKHGAKAGLAGAAIGVAGSLYQRATQN